MIWNYLKLSLKVLQRRKFFTFISLFGISSTLMILTVVITFFQNELGDNAPLSQQDNLVILQSANIQMMEPDTLFVIDTLYQNGTMTFDTTIDITETSSRDLYSQVSIKYLQEYFFKAENAVTASLYEHGVQFGTYRNGKKLKYIGNYTDAAFFEIFDFNFIEGRPYQKQQVEQNMRSAVISETLAEEYFGSKTGVVGKEVEFDRKKYEVIGVIEDVTTSQQIVQSDIFVPYTLSNPDNFTNPSIAGNFNGVFLAAAPSKVSLLKEEIESIGVKVPSHDPTEYNKTRVICFTAMEYYARVFFEEDGPTSVSYFYWVLGILLTMLLVLPTLNLININITRIIERSSEIGVRKSFGANTQNLVFQFLFENIILTIIGALIGWILALGLLQFINAQRYLGEVTLHFSPIIFFYCLAICLVFGILSGIYPAWKMSNLKIVDALKNKRND